VINLRPPRVFAHPSSLRTLSRYSDLLYTLILFRLHVRYKQSFLGWAWAVVEPLALMGIYILIFSPCHDGRDWRGPLPHFCLLCALTLDFLFQFYPNLLTKMHSPREIAALAISGAITSVSLAYAYSKSSEAVMADLV
jgi:hypothetical protein